VAEISIPALIKNVATLRSLCKKEIIPVVKADAYGHGMVSVAKALVSKASCDMLAVATLEEAIELRKRLHSSVDILVLSGFLPHQIDAYLKYKLVPVIHSLNHLKSLLGRKNCPEIHLKFDTGMHRLGILEDELPEAMKVLSKLPVKLSGLMSHFAESEATTSSFSDQQISVFEQIHRELALKRFLNTDARIHISNSGGIFRSKLSISNAVRPGISLYGVTPNDRFANASSLVPVLTWKTRILSIKTIKRGDTVGYGRTYRAQKREKIAILPIGYADGYPRLLSNRGEVLIAGKRAAVRGRVSMDLTTVDCTGITGVREGMEVTLIGRNNKEFLSGWEIAHWANTIPYEVYCGLAARVPRIYLE
jgi:alanine racemase